jgi:hypothetical protein
MSDVSNVQFAPPHLDSLIEGLDVEFINLSECLVNPGWRLDLGGSDVPGIHYTLSGSGRLVVDGHSPIELEPHAPGGRPPIRAQTVG